VLDHAARDGDAIDSPQVGKGRRAEIVQGGVSGEEAKKILNGAYVTVREVQDFREPDPQARIEQRQSRSQPSKSLPN